jgi:hypothetical protein
MSRTVTRTTELPTLTIPSEVPSTSQAGTRFVVAEGAAEAGAEAKLVGAGIRESAPIRPVVRPEVEQQFQKLIAEARAADAKAADAAVSLKASGGKSPYLYEPALQNSLAKAKELRSQAADLLAKESALSKVGGTRPGAETYWQGPKIFLEDGTAVLGQIDETCASNCLKSALLRKNPQALQGTTLKELEADLLSHRHIEEGKFIGMHTDDLAMLAKKYRLNVDEFKWMTLNDLEQAMNKPGTLAIVQLHQDGKTHFVIVEAFAQSKVAGPDGAKIALVQIVDSNEAARMMVTVDEFMKRWGRLAGNTKGNTLIIKP